MEISFSPEIAEKLTHSAAQKGRNPNELAQEILAQYFDEESRFIDAVKHGEAALQRGDSLTHEEVGKRLHRFLDS